MTETETNEPDTTKKLDDMTSTLQRNAATSDKQRLQAVAGLINVFNFAVQEQGGRHDWDEHDTQAFSVALAALESIGQRDRNRTEIVPYGKTPLKSNVY